MGVLRCLAGSTRIHTIDGMIQIRDLVGKQPFLYSTDGKGKIILEKAVSVFSSGAKDLIRVHLDNGTYIDCTEDHRFMLSDGSYVEAGKLQPMTSLMALSKHLGKNGRFYIGVTGYHPKNHAVVVAESGGKSAKGLHVHHVDHNPLNDHPDNLEILTKSEHAKRHCGELLSNQERITNDRKGKTLEEWLGEERAAEVRANMSRAKKKQAVEVPIWNKGMDTDEYKSHYDNGFGNQHVSNHKVVKVEYLNRQEETFDIQMSTYHNFVAEEVFVHNCDHPDIEEFIHAKQNQTRLTGFNISVGVTDKFMECLDSGEPFPLTFEGETYREVDPAALWDTLMRSTWDWAEPGVLFIDTINKMNNLHYCEKIAATNPCGEQPLPPNGACLLGSFNLVKYVTVSRAFDFDQFKKDIYHVVRAMDNVVDRAKYPLYEQEKEAKNKRRMGLGVTGLANAIEALGASYGSLNFLEWEDKILSFLNQHCYRASAKLGKEKGSFPLYDKVRYLGGKFIRSLDEETQDLIDQLGIRNSHLTSIAPTGTISLTADNVSSGIEPVFAHAYDRTVQTFDGPIVESVTDYGLREFGVRGKPSSEVTIQEHLAVLLTAQKNVDSAVSKTCNVGDDVSWDQFKTLYTEAYKGGAKGCTTFRASGKRMGILKKKEDEPAEETSCKIDPVSGRRECE